MNRTLSHKYYGKEKFSSNGNKINNEVSSDYLVQRHTEAITSDVVHQKIYIRKRFVNVIDKTKFSIQVDKFANYFMYYHDLKMSREKNQSTNVSPNDK